jgi:hypothetical protein
LLIRKTKNQSTLNLSALILLFFFFRSVSAYETERVVLVIIDGLRYTEGLGDPEHRFTPRMAELANQGALVADFTNNGFTYTSRAVPAIWTGGWTNMNNFSDSTCNGSSNSYSSLPSLFEYYRKHLNRPASDCVYSLLELCSWKGSFHPEFGPDYWPLYHTAGITDDDVWQETRQILSDLAPHLLVMYFADVDHGGHSGNWDEYTRNITIADSLVGELWDTLQADPLYADVTTMLVTNDHGRHTTNFSGHGDSCIGCRQIQLLALGPDVNAGLTSDIPRVIPDITPTIGALLGFDTELATGTAMLELFSDQTAIKGTVVLPTSTLDLFPNPTNAGASIHFSLQEAGPITLSIFDINGRLVNRLFEDSLNEGPHHVNWGGTSQSGMALPSGTYLIELKSRQTRALAKLVLLK